MQGESLSNHRVKELLRAIEDQEHELAAQMRDYYRAGRLTQFVMRQANPQIQAELEYIAAQRSIVEARQSAQRHEGNIVIF